MNELERRIEALKKQLNEKQVRLNISEDMYYNNLKSYGFWNGVLTCVIIGFVFWTATHICQT